MTSELNSHPAILMENVYNPIPGQNFSQVWEQKWDNKGNFQDNGDHKSLEDSFAVGPGQGSANLSCEGLDNKCFRLYKPSGLCYNHSTLHQNSHRQWLWFSSNKCYLWLLKFEFHRVFISHKVLFFFWFFSHLLQIAKTNLSSWDL